MTTEELKQFYEEDEDFHEYVDRFCRCKDITEAQALDHRMMEIVADSYKSKDKR